MKKFTLYGLRGPGEDKIRYVGITCRKSRSPESIAKSAASNKGKHRHTTGWVNMMQENNRGAKNPRGQIDLEKS